MTKLVLVVHNVRSAHNVGSLLRTAEGLGISKVILSGYTPYPIEKSDERLPHIAQKVHQQIHKTALGAEEYLDWVHVANVEAELRQLKKAGYVIAALEQTPKSVSLSSHQPRDKIALIVGSEVGGIDQVLLNQVDELLEIPMAGRKESFNVAVAAAIALYHLKNT
jgi:23S rRNA (guanosine2251-2'-O)-methyltransferase